jgi:hypothetical protein
MLQSCTQCFLPYIHSTILDWTLNVLFLYQAVLISATLARARNLLQPLPDTVAGLTSPYLVNVYKVSRF